jgi:hypothetical protein
MPRRGPRHVGLRRNQNAQRVEGSNQTLPVPEVAQGRILTSRARLVPQKRSNCHPAERKHCGHACNLAVAPWHRCCKRRFLAEPATNRNVNHRTQREAHVKTSRDGRISRAAAPITKQHVQKIRGYGAVAHLRIELGEQTWRESETHLNRPLVDTITLTKG